MCLPYNEIEAYLHHYAGKFQNSEFEHWELVNEAWLGIYDLTIPQFASNGIRWAILRYKQKKYRRKYRGSGRAKGITIQSIDEEITNNIFCKDTLMAPLSKKMKNIDDSDYVTHLLHNPKLSLANKLLIDQRYFQDLTLTQIGKIHGRTKEAIRIRLKKLNDILRAIAA